MTPRCFWAAFSFRGSQSFFSSSRFNDYKSLHPFIWPTHGEGVKSNQLMVWCNNQKSLKKGYFLKKFPFPKCFLLHLNRHSVWAANLHRQSCKVVIQFQIIISLFSEFLNNFYILDSKWFLQQQKTQQSL